MIDLHFHILPGMDDGPTSLEEATDLARAAVAAGSTTVVATPHVSERYPDTTGLGVANAVLMLRRALAAEEITLDVRRGAEVALSSAMALPDAELGRLRFGKGPWLLVECPSTGHVPGLEASLHALAARGFRLLIAHPERIEHFRDDRAVLPRLVSSGMLCQVTAGALTGRFGTAVEAFARRLAADGLVHVVSSDAHSTDGRPPSVLPELRQAGVTEEGIEFLTHQAPEALLAGRSIPMPPTLLAPGKRPRRLRRTARS